MTDTAIEVRDLAKTFPGGVEAVRGVSFGIRPGEVFGLLGPNGAGKTTTLRMITGLLTPSGGSVHVFGERVLPADLSGAARLGVCPQEPVLWDDLTCAEHLSLMAAMYELPSGTARTRTHALLGELSLADKSRALAKSLSGGMKRRLNLALALVHDPDVVVLDEPTAGLDPQSRALLWDYIRRLSRDRGKTVILTTHFMEEADRLSDRVAIMDHGALLVLDTPAALRARIGEGDVLDITFAEAAPAVLAHDLRGLPGVSRAAADGAHASLQALNATAQLQSIFDVLARHGARVIDVRIRANSLEDVFLQLTGRSLRGES
jgi:ABC-2 type transport system ATP-binding protein